MLDIHDNLPSAADSSWFVAKDVKLCSQSYSCSFGGAKIDK